MAEHPGGRANSLRRRLLGLIFAGTLLIWALAAAMSYHQARHDVREMMDATMAQTASLLMAHAHSSKGFTQPVDLWEKLKGVRPRHADLASEFQIGRADGSIAARTAGMPQADLNAPHGFSNLRIGNEEWRSLIVSTGDDGPRVQVLQSMRQRDREALEIAAKTVLPLGLLLPVLLGLIYWSVRRGLKPMDDLAAEVSLRSSENLQTVAIVGVPLEARPLVAALNRLLERLAQSLDNERRFTADAAHELRTPLAAIRVQAQVALASADNAQHRHALNQVVVGTERATRLVEQLLRLARLDPVARLPLAEPVNLTEIASALYEEFIDDTERGDDFHLEISAEAVVVNGDADLLAVALRNLLDNARRYTAAGCSMTLFVRNEHGQAVAGVRDAGGGVAAEELPQLIERFYRGSRAAGEGSGLGLAIVRRVAELHGARLEIENLRPGFSAGLRWVSPQEKA